MESISNSAESHGGGAALIGGLALALVPFFLGLPVLGVIGFDAVTGTLRVVILVLGAIALISPVLSAWLFWKSVADYRWISAVVAVPMLTFSVYLSNLWLRAMLMTLR